MVATVPRQSSNRQVPFATALLGLILASAIVQFGRAEQGGQGRTGQDRTTWRDYGGSPDNARYMTLDQINKSNLDKLTVAWTYASSDNIPYVFNPIVIDDVMYVLARNNSLVALHATTGKEIWVHEGLDGIAARGINYWESKDREDRRLIFQINNYLQEIDARTGRSVLSFGKDGVVDLREGLRRDFSAIPSITVHSPSITVHSRNPGKVFENLIILGSSPGEQYVSPPGDVRAFDVITGKLVWQFHTIPHPGEYGYDTWPKDAWQYVGGANTWGELTIDPERAIAYFPTGSPTYDFYGADRHGANLFGNSLLALDARTGKRLWHFQNVHHDLWDYDNASAPVLTTIRRNGRTVDVVAMAAKTGFLYVFDRVTGQPIWPILERPVPRSDVPGERSWPTQPFPTAPPPFASQRFTADDINPFILTSEERERWKKRITNARDRGLFTPPSLQDTLAMPGALGGANWGATASNPIDGSVYVLNHNQPSLLRLTTEISSVPRGRSAIDAAPPELVKQGRDIYENRCQYCHGRDRRGGGGNPSLADVTLRVGQVPLKQTITGGGAGMPGFNDLNNEADLAALLAFLSSPIGQADASPDAGVISMGGPVVGSGGAPAGRIKPLGQPMFMVGPPYPKGIRAPEVRMYSGHNMYAFIAKPPYSTLTAYDLNSGTIKWQVPAGGDDSRAVAQGARDTGFMVLRTGIITTSAGLLFQAGGDAKLRAYDVKNGRVLWTGQLPAGSRGVPSMYEVNGRQYIVVNATSAGVPGGVAPGPDRGYVAFALSDK